MQQSGKWGCILDTNGNVGTFMRYKSYYWGAWEIAKNQEKPDKEKIASRVIPAIIGGGTMAIDLDIFSCFANPVDYLNPDVLGENIMNPKEWLEYFNLVELGKKYPDYVK